jgi:hypothetical protein
MVDLDGNGSGDVRTINGAPGPNTFDASDFVVGALVS